MHLYHGMAFLSKEESRLCTGKVLTVCFSNQVFCVIFSGISLSYAGEDFEISFK
jgi:hypothetical protein